jgi:putative transposase
VKATLIDRTEDMPMVHQCELLNIGRTTMYYQPHISALKLELMRRIDELYTEDPTRGTRRISNALWKRYSLPAGRGRVRKLMRLLGIGAIYPVKQLSWANSQHKKYPYLLRGVPITHVNHVWSTDITYVRLKGGYVYLTAVIDWYSRFVLAWRISTTMDTRFCVEALQEALAKYGTPEIFNTDQGSQFTCAEFTGVLEAHGIKISMDGKGRALDNVFVERLWRTVKQEDIYLKEYETVAACKKGLEAYFLRYNTIREHQSLNYNYPEEVYFGTVILKQAA